MQQFQRVSGYFWVLAAVGLVTGCAMSPKAESAPPADRQSPTAVPAPAAASAAPVSPSVELAPEPESEPKTLAEAEALLDRARADLDRLALNDLPRSGAAPAAAAPGGAPSPAPRGRAEARRDDKSADGAEEAKAADACQTACKAYSSLTRASDAVCRLDADGGKRCERARQIREEASHKVASCGCGR